MKRLMVAFLLMAAMVCGDETAVLKYDGAGEFASSNVSVDDGETTTTLYVPDSTLTTEQGRIVVGTSGSYGDIFLWPEDQSIRDLISAAGSTIMAWVEANFLRLDTSNDPLTGGLQITPGPGINSLTTSTSGGGTGVQVVSIEGFSFEAATDQRAFSATVTPDADEDGLGFYLFMEKDDEISSATDKGMVVLVVPNNTIAATHTSTAAEFSVNDAGETAGGIDKTAVGVQVNAIMSGAASGGNRFVYGSQITATGSTDGTSTATGIYVSASGSDTNWAIFTDSGDVGISENLIVSTNANVLGTLDADGNWNLGDDSLDTGVINSADVNAPNIPSGTLTRLLGLESDNDMATTTDPSVDSFITNDDTWKDVSVLTGGFTPNWISYGSDGLNWDSGDVAADRNIWFNVPNMPGTTISQIRCKIGAVDPDDGIVLSLLSRLDSTTAASAFTVVDTATYAASAVHTLDIDPDETMSANTSYVIHVVLDSVGATMLDAGAVYSIGFETTSRTY